LKHERNSVYTKYLLQALQEKPHINVTQLLMSVRNNVLKETQKTGVQQLPWDSVSLTKPFCFKSCVSESDAQLQQKLAEFEKKQAYLAQQQLEFEQQRQAELERKRQAELEKQRQRQAELERQRQAELEQQRQQAELERKRAEFERQQAELKRQQTEFEQRQAELERKRQAELEKQRQQAELDKQRQQQQVAGTVFRDRLKDGSLGPEMVWIPAGRFRMGDIQGGGSSDEKPVHSVNIDKFAMGKYEVTFAEYDKFAQATGRNKPSDNGWGRGNRPVINVSWNDATAYVKWLIQQTSKQYRLPTEAEWEYAARAGTETKYWWGNDIGTNKANCYKDHCGDKFKYTAPIGSFNSNQFGVYDTVGNVWEWTCSEYENPYKGKEKRCLSKKSANNSSLFVLRGGSWFIYARWTRSAHRNGNEPTYRIFDVGLRLARH